MRLIIDGLKTREGNLPFSYPYSQIDASIYLGAAPSLNIQVKIEKLYNMNLNGYVHFYLRLSKIAKAVNVSFSLSIPCY